MMFLLWLLAVLLLLVLGVAMWFSHRYAWWRRPVDWSAPRILMYHMVSEHQPKAKFNKLRVPPQQFAAQLAWLQQQGFHFLTLSELRQQWKTGRLKPKSIAITFDDGYQDNFAQALPILQRYHAKATIYVVVDRHHRDWSSDKKAHHNSGELMREPKLTDDEVLELVNSGLIEIGSHTMTHANLSKLSTAEKQQQLSESRAALQQLTGQAIESFAYPFGIYDELDVAAAKQAGYLDAVTTVEGIQPRDPMPDFWQLQRIKISGKDNLLAFKCRIHTGKRGL